MYQLYHCAITYICSTWTQEGGWWDVNGTIHCIYSSICVIKHCDHKLSLSWEITRQCQSTFLFQRGCPIYLMASVLVCFGSIVISFFLYPPFSVCSVPRCARDDICRIWFPDDLHASLWLRQCGVQHAACLLCHPVVHHHQWTVHLH